MPLPALPGNLLAGNVGASSALNYGILRQKYDEFSYPVAQIVLGDKVFASDKDDMPVDSVHVELSAGFEATVASFRIYNVYDPDSGKFRYDSIQKQVVLGNSMKISLGYLGAMEPVFVGFVAGVAFHYENGELPYIEVSGMDVKGLMMAGDYAGQCTAKSYGEAVREILTRTAYENLKSAGGYIDLAVEDTPDKPVAAQQKESAYTIEMVSESDYEFVVKAAKKFNYEFFVDRGRVLFRKAKSDTNLLATIGAGEGLITFHVEYSMTGIVGVVEARAMNAGEGKIIKAQEKFPAPGDSISTGKKAKNLTGSGKKVYIDPTIDSQSQADARAASLKETMSYRLGSLEGECVGIPDLLPGRFIQLSGLGVPVDNRFYLSKVEHDFTGDRGYRTRITGVANRVQTEAGAGGAGMTGGMAGAMGKGALGL